MNLICSSIQFVQKTEKYISEEPKLKDLHHWHRKFTFLTDPPGADVYIREYSDAKGEWKKIGTTPVDSVKMPSLHFLSYQNRKARI